MGDHEGGGWRARSGALPVAAVVGAVIAAAVVLTRPEPPAQVRERTVPSPSIDPSISPPSGGGPFHGEDHREDGTVVVPVTFPDGTTAVVVHLSSLELGTKYVAPRAYVQGPRVCEPQVSFDRSEIVGGLIRPGPPLAVFEGAGGDPVALWPGKRGTWDILAYDFGPWVATLFCEVDPDEDAEALSVWARNFDAKVTPDGLLVLDLGPPLRLLAGEQAGPSVEFWNGETAHAPLVTLTVAGCVPSPIELAPGGQTAHGCFEGGIQLYALADPGFLRAVSDGLQVRKVRAPSE